MSTYFDEEQKLWSALDNPTAFNPSISLGHAILWSLAKNPHKIIQINHETNIQLTSRFMRRQTVRAALNLQKLGYCKGDIFGFIVKNSHYVAPLIYASICIGCPVNPLDSSFSKPEFMHMLSLTKPKAIFCDVDSYDLIQECLNDLENDAKIFTFSGQSGDSIPVEDLLEKIDGEMSFTPVDVDGENTTAAIVCTSGSTGAPKGVCVSHANLLLQAAENAVDEDDTLLTFSSVYWISGLVLLVCNAIRGFCRVITTERFSVELLLDIIEVHRVTFLMSASHFLVLALKCDQFYKTNLSTIRVIMCAGSRLAPSTASGIMEYLKKSVIVQVYGMSEVGGCISASIAESPEDTSVGHLQFCMKAKIIDDLGNRLGVDETGEICTKTKYKFLGYFVNDEATHNSVDDEGFLKTGDIGYFDKDGKLYLVDRKKEMLKYCSSQISPTELESFLIQCASIKAVCVVGIPDNFAGDLPAAVVIQNDYEEPVSCEQIEQMITDNFADYKRLRGGVYFVDTFPLTPSGKVIRRHVREMAIRMYNEQVEPDS